MACYIYKHPDTDKPIYGIGLTYGDEHRGDISKAYINDITEQWVLVSITNPYTHMYKDHYILLVMSKILEKQRVRKNANLYTIENIYSFFKTLTKTLEEEDVQIEIKLYLGDLRKYVSKCK